MRVFIVALLFGNYKLIGSLILADEVISIKTLIKNSINAFQIINANELVETIYFIESNKKKHEEHVLKVVFEAIYFRHKHLAQGKDISSFSYKRLLELRKQVWYNNNCVPPLLFAMIFKNVIQHIAERVESKAFSVEDSYNLISKVLSDKKSEEILKSVPDEPDVVNGFVSTWNKQGYMATQLDHFSKAFISLPKNNAGQKIKLLEIGSAYGVAALKALGNGGVVFANDIDMIHLAILFKKAAGDCHDRLIPVLGEFPEELEFPDNYFDGILISRVMHFFTGENIVLSLKKLKQWIKPGGKIYIVNETPYLCNWQKFLPDYLARKARGDEWPGLILDPKIYANFRSVDLPDLVHWLDRETLKYAILKAGFVENEIDSLEYINREGQFPDDLIMPSEGRESVGCCLTKKTNIL